MNKIFLGLALLGLSLQANAQDAWTIGQVEVQPFDRIIVTRGLDVDIQMGDTHEVEIQTLNMPNDAIFVKQRGNTLIMGIKWKNLLRYAKDTDHVDTEVKIIVPRLTYLRLKLGGESTLEGPLTGEEFAVKVGGASILVITDLQVDNFYAKVRGAAELTVSGEAKEQKVYVRGASTYHGTDLVTEYTQVWARGASEGHVQAYGWLKATARGASDIYYVTEPKVEDLLSTGASEIMASK